MRAFEATAVIRARPEQVWAILTDAPGYTDWDSSVARIEGRIAPGESIKLESKAAPGRSFPIKVTEFDPPRRMVWSGGMPIPGLFKGVRTFTLAPEGDGTRYTMREEYTGLLLPMIWPSMPDLGPSFEQWSAGLGRYAEEKEAHVG
jgi:hypothetical protein